MKKVPDKYRGKKEYSLVYCRILQAARQGQTIVYGDIAKIMGLPPSGHHMASEVGQILGEISEDEHVNGRPMLTAVVVSVDGMPGQGFFTCARQLGKLHEDSRDAERHFWESEKAAVFETWRDAEGN